MSPHPPTAEPDVRVSPHPALGKMVFRSAYSHRASLGFFALYRLCLYPSQTAFYQGYRAGLPDAPISLDSLRLEVGITLPLLTIRPRIITSDAAIPSLMTQGRLCGFSCSAGMSLPGLRLHLYTGGPILTVTPLYAQAMPTVRYILSARPTFNRWECGLTSPPRPSLTFPVWFLLTMPQTMVRLLAISRRD